MGLRPSAPRAGASACSATSAQTESGTERRALRVAGMKLVEVRGLAPLEPIRAARLPRAAFAALPHLGNWELERDSHPRPSPYEGAALTAAPPSHETGPDGGTCTPDHSRPRRACWLLHYVRMSSPRVGEPTKLAAKAGVAPASRRLTDGRSPVELPGKGGPARSSLLRRTGPNGRGGGTRTPGWLGVGQLP